MAAFRIGDRVRIVAPGNLHGKTGTVWDIQGPVAWWLRMLGETERVWCASALRFGVHPKETAYCIDVDGYGRHAMPGVYGFPDYWLRPLDDPKADAFIESIKKMKPYTEPTVKPREVPSSWPVTKEEK